MATISVIDYGMGNIHSVAKALQKVSDRKDKIYITSSIKEIKESINNLNTRLSNLKKINKSLNEFEDNNSSLSWNELRNLTSEVHEYREE